MTKKITFSLPEEALRGTTGGKLLGDFNNWNPDTAPTLKKHKDGSYKTSVTLEEGKTYHYRFLLDDGRWENDYQAQRYEKIDGLGIDNSVLTVPITEKKVTQPKKTKKLTTPEATKKATAKKSSSKKSDTEDKKASNKLAIAEPVTGAKKATPKKEVSAKKKAPKGKLKEAPEPKK